MKLIRWICVLAIASLMFACSDKTENEKKIDKASEDAKEAVDDAASKAKDALDGK